MEPPAQVRGVEPKKPARKRKMSCAPMFGASPAATTVVRQCWPQMMMMGRERTDPDHVNKQRNDINRIPPHRLTDRACKQSSKPKPHKKQPCSKGFRNSTHPKLLTRLRQSRRINGARKSHNESNSGNQHRGCYPRDVGPALRIHRIVLGLIAHDENGLSFFPFLISLPFECTAPSRSCSRKFLAQLPDFNPIQRMTHPRSKTLGLPQRVRRPGSLELFLLNSLVSLIPSFVIRIQNPRMLALLRIPRIWTRGTINRRTPMRRRLIWCTRPSILVFCIPTLKSFSALAVPFILLFDFPTESPVLEDGLHFFPSQIPRPVQVQSETKSKASPKPSQQ